MTSIYIYSIFQIQLFVCQIVLEWSVWYLVSAAYVGVVVCEESGGDICFRVSGLQTSGPHSQLECGHSRSEREGHLDWGQL